MLVVGLFITVQGARLQVGGCPRQVMLVPIINKREVRQDGFTGHVTVDLIHVILCEVTCGLAADIPITEPLGFLHPARQRLVASVTLPFDLRLFLFGQVGVCYPIANMPTNPISVFEEITNLFTLRHACRMALCNRSCNGTKVRWPASYHSS